MTEQESQAANEMRITFVVQIDELVNVIEHYVAKMEKAGDEEEAHRAQGAIDYAKKVTDQYRYNGRYVP